ncbi:MAG: YraN family protein [Defluviitaleaceae bacterium]|nr:YraN family protein [Defluviitaleaceae bacterium]
MSNKVQLGLFGQKAAENFLLNKGMVLRESNFRAFGGEIDLIMKDDIYIVFIEVKYRKGLSHGFPSEAVDFRKQQRIKKVALQYIARHNLHDNDFRFDVVEILEIQKKLAINHIENAF